MSSSFLITQFFGGCGCVVFVFVVFVVVAVVVAAVAVVADGATIGITQMSKSNMVPSPPACLMLGPPQISAGDGHEMSRVTTVSSTQSTHSGSPHWWLRCDPHRWCACQSSIPTA